MPDLRQTPLHAIAHARAGDKGNTLNVAVFCYDPAHFPYVVEQLTEARVAEVFSAHRPSGVRRYLLPRLAACNFVLDDVLAGGVNNSLRLDRHGKGLSYLLLATTLQLPVQPTGRAPRGTASVSSPSTHPGDKP